MKSKKLSKILISIFCICASAVGFSAHANPYVYGLIQAYAAKEICTCVHVVRPGYEGTSLTERKSLCLELIIESAPEALRDTLTESFTSSDQGPAFVIEVSESGVSVFLRDSLGAKAVFLGEKKGCLLL